MEIWDETCGPKFGSIALFTAESKFVIASSTTLPMWIFILSHAINCFKTEEYPVGITIFGLKVINPETKLLLFIQTINT